MEFLEQQRELLEKYVLPFDKKGMKKCLDAIEEFPGLNLKEVQAYSWEEYITDGPHHWEYYTSTERPKYVDNVQTKNILLFYFNGLLIDGVSHNSFNPMVHYSDPLYVLSKYLKENVFSHCWYQSGKDHIKPVFTSKLLDVAEIIEVIRFIDCYEQLKRMTGAQLKEFCKLEQKVFIFEVNFINKKLQETVFPVEKINSSFGIF